MRLLMLLLLTLSLAGCRDYEAEEKIRADAQVGISANQAMAQAAIAENEANAQIAVAESQKQATIAMSNNQLAWETYRADQATKQASIWADKLPLVASIATVALLASIILIYRGKIGLRRVDREAQISLLPSPPLPPSLLSPPLQVTAEAQRRNALVAPGDAPGVWLLVLADGRQITMRPRQLTGPQGGVE